jgi:hypothetical protein
MKATFTLPKNLGAAPSMPQVSTPLQVANKIGSGMTNSIRQPMMRRKRKNTLQQVFQSGM